MSGHPPIQVVDENDRPTGTASIAEARQKGLWHRIARVMVEDESGRILLQKRSASVHTYPGCWDTSAAGHVDAGESYIDAAKRELAEETGLRTESLEEIASYKSDKGYQNQTVLRFNKIYKTLLVDSGYRFVPDPDEVDELKWFSKKQVKQLIQDTPEKTTDGLKDIVSRYYS